MKQELDIKTNFIDIWGALGTQWGINRSMAQIHALLLMHKDGLDTDTIMEELQLSRGNAHTNIRELMNWNLVKKKVVAGSRKDFFVAEHDIWKVAITILKERKRRELEPVQQAIKELQDKINQANPHEDQAHQIQLLNELDAFLKQMDEWSDIVIKNEKSKLFQLLKKML